MVSPAVTATIERHGTITGYTTDRCRCDPCADRWREYQREWKAALIASPDFVHGRRVGYVAGCRCDDCRAANARYNLDRKAKLRGSTATPHGTVDGYGSYGCRCDGCSAAKRAATHDHYLRNQLKFLEKATHRDAMKDRDRRVVTSRDLYRLIARFRGRCAYCDTLPQYLEIDHVIPLSRGGRHAIGNLLPACRTCNRRKNARFVSEWRAR